MYLKQMKKIKFVNGGCDMEKCKNCINYSRNYADGRCAALVGGMKTVQKMKGWRNKEGECAARKPKKKG